MSRIHELSSNQKSVIKVDSANNYGSQEVAETLGAYGNVIFAFRHGNEHFSFFGCITRRIAEGGSGYVSFGCPSVGYAMSTTIGTSFSFDKGRAHSREFWEAFTAFATLVSHRLDVMRVREREGSTAQVVVDDLLGEDSPYRLSIPTGENA